MPQVLSVRELKDRLIEKLEDNIHLSFSETTQTVSVRCVATKLEEFKKQQKVADEIATLILASGYKLTYDDTDLSKEIYYQSMRFERNMEAK